MMIVYIKSSIDFWIGLFKIIFFVQLCWNLFSLNNYPKETQLHRKDRKVKKLKKQLKKQLKDKLKNKDIMAQEDYLKKYQSFWTSPKAKVDPQVAWEVPKYLLLKIA